MSTFSGRHCSTATQPAEVWAVRIRAAENKLGKIVVAGKTRIMLQDNRDVALLSPPIMMVQQSKGTIMSNI
jgi:hypothetical protein